MSKSSDDMLLEIYLEEYRKHRDEIQNRIKLQNGMAQQGIRVTALFGILLGILLSLPFGSFGIELNKPLFILICIYVLLFHAMLMELTLANCIFQLGMIFQIVRYWNWIVIKKIYPMNEKSRDVFLWDIAKEPPWELPIDRHIRNYQEAFIFALCLSSVPGFILSLFLKMPAKISSVPGFIFSLSLEKLAKIYTVTKWVGLIGMKAQYGWILQFNR